MLIWCIIQHQLSRDVLSGGALTGVNDALRCVFVHVYELQIHVLLSSMRFRSLFVCAFDICYSPIMSNTLRRLDGLMCVSCQCFAVAAAAAAACIIATKHFLHYVNYFHQLIDALECCV